MSSFNFSLYEPVGSATKPKKSKPAEIESPTFDFSLYEPISPEKPKEKEFSNADVFKDVAKQAGKEFVVGAGGTLGDLAGLTGLEAKTDAPEARNKADFEILERMQDPNYKPSLADLYALSDEDISPAGIKFPTSENIKTGIEGIGGPGEAETVQGRYAGRIARNYGSSVATGNLNPAGAIASGIAGQTVEEYEGGPLAQGAAEIIGLLAGEKGGKAIARAAGLTPKYILSSGNKAVQKKIDALRKLGYGDDEIVLAVNSEKTGVSKIATKSGKTEEAFEKFANKSDQLVSDILSSEIPGVQKGTKHIHQMASDAYGQVAKDASKLVIKDSTPFINSATDVVKEVRKNLGKNPEAEAFLKRLHDAVIASTQNPTAESFMNFYKELNSAGKWMGRSQKDRLINKVKDGIKDTFKSEGPTGRKLAERFEEVNKGIRKAYQAEEAVELLNKAATQNGNDYNKMVKLFDKGENVQILEQALGVRQTENLRQIAKAGKEIKDFDKKWKAATSFGSGIELGTGYKTLSYILQMNPIGIASVLSLKGGKYTVGKLAEKSLRDPKYQDLIRRGLHAVKNSSPRQLKIVHDQFKQYFKENDIDIPMD